MDIVGRAIPVGELNSGLDRLEQTTPRQSFLGTRKDTRDPSGDEPSRKAACASHPDDAHGLERGVPRACWVPARRPSAESIGLISE